MPQDRVPSLTFKDGGTFNAVSRKFSDVDSRVLLMNYFNETSRELSLIQFFGADYRNGVSRFISELEKNPKYENAFRTKGKLGEVDAVKRFLDRTNYAEMRLLLPHFFLSSSSSAFLSLLFSFDFLATPTKTGLNSLS